MYSGRGMGMGLYLADVAHKRQVRARSEADKKLSECRREMDEQKRLLDTWLITESKNEQHARYVHEVRNANKLLSKKIEAFESKPLLGELKSTRDDLTALNDALAKGDVTQLIERVKVHMQCRSKVAVALGTSLAVIGFGVMVFSVAVCPILLIAAGLAVFAAGCYLAYAGSQRDNLDKAFSLFNVARKIDPNVDWDKDVNESRSGYRFPNMENSYY